MALGQLARDYWEWVQSPKLMITVSVTWEDPPPQRANNILHSFGDLDFVAMMVHHIFRVVLATQPLTNAVA